MSKTSTDFIREFGEEYYLNNKDKKTKYKTNVVAMDGGAFNVLADKKDNDHLTIY